MKALFAILGPTGTTILVLVALIWAPPMRLPIVGVGWGGGYAVQAAALRKGLSDAEGERDAARKLVEARSVSLSQCRDNRREEADACDLRLTAMANSWRDRLERCESRQDRIRQGFAPREGDAHAPPVCLPRDLVPAERVFEFPARMDPAQRTPG